MAFAVDERVIMHYCPEDPLVNGEGHFTASFGSPWFTNCTCNFYCSLTVPMARTKQTKWRLESKAPRQEREPSKWGTAAAGVTHRPPLLPARPGTSANSSYKGMS